MENKCSLSAQFLEIERSFSAVQSPPISQRPWKPNVIVDLPLSSPIQNRSL